MISMILFDQLLRCISPKPFRERLEDSFFYQLGNGLCIEAYDDGQTVMVLIGESNNNLWDSSRVDILLTLNDLLK